MEVYKICFPFARLGHGGSFISTKTLIESLSKYDELNISVALPKAIETNIFSSLSCTVNYEKKNSKYLLLNHPFLIFRFFANLKHVILAIKYLHQHKPDILHINDSRTMLIWGIAAKLRNIPVIWHVRDQAKKYDRIRLKLASVLLFNTKGSMLRFNTHQNKLFYVVPNVVSPQELFPPKNKDNAKAKLGINPNQRVIGLVSNLKPIKRIELFLEIALMFKDSGHVFLLVGRDGETNYYRDVINSFKLQNGLDDLIYLGERRDTSTIYQALDVFCLTSKQETFGRVLAEAMLCEVPCVAYNVKGVDEVIKDQVTGFLAENTGQFYDCIKKLLDDDDLRQKMGKSGRNYVLKNHHPDEVVQLILSHYKRIRSGPNDVK